MASQTSFVSGSKSSTTPKFVSKTHEGFNTLGLQDAYNQQQQTPTGLQSYLNIYNKNYGPPTPFKQLNPRDKYLFGADQAETDQYFKELEQGQGIAPYQAQQQNSYLGSQNAAMLHGGAGQETRGNYLDRKQEADQRASILGPLFGQKLGAELRGQQGAHSLQFADLQRQLDESQNRVGTDIFSSASQAAGNAQQFRSQLLAQILGSTGPLPHSKSVSEAISHSQTG